MVGETNLSLCFVSLITRKNMNLRIYAQSGDKYQVSVTTYQIDYRYINNK